MSHKHSFSLGGGGHSVTSDIGGRGVHSERDPKFCRETPGPVIAELELCFEATLKLKHNLLQEIKNKGTIWIISRGTQNAVWSN